MKPTPKTSSRHNNQRNFPLTDYNYQSKLDTSSVAVTGKRAAQELRGLWKLSTGFFGAEARLDYATELAVFSLITVLSAWPIVSMIGAVTRMVRNY